VSRYLLIDFGTTSTKSALVDLGTGIFSHLLRHPSIPRNPTPSGRYEISLGAIAVRFEQICTRYQELTDPDPFAGIVLCSEMHGFAVLDSAPGHLPLTPYISWLDQRSLEPVDGVDSFSLVTDRLGSGRFRAITGMRPRPGLPLLNLVHWARSTPDVPPAGLVVSLPGWLALNASTAAPGDTGAAGIAKPRSPAAASAPPVEHPTMLAGMAFYDVERREVSPELVDLVRDLTGFGAVLGATGSGAAVPVAGHWHSDAGAIPLYVGVGDHQCSLLGAGLTPGDCASVNLGTGSQVSVLSAADSGGHGKAADEVELRPYFDGGLLSTITHIPAGRALTEYIGFLERIAEIAAPGNAGKDVAAASKPRVGNPRPCLDFWQQLEELTIDDLDSATLEFDLSIFQGARNYSAGGSLSRIEEGSLTPRNYLASLLKSFVCQYREALQVIDPEHQLERLLLSGGIARNLPNLTHHFADLTGYSTLPAADLDESLLGLRSLALVADERAGTCLEAQQLFGRGCEVAQSS